LPVHLSGNESQKSRESKAFGAWLQDVTKLPIAYADERYSSAFAEEHLMSMSFTKKKRKARLDMLAAQAILQGYIEGKRHDDPGALSD
jgi:putative Holliday junction resolvase